MEKYIFNLYAKYLIKESTVVHLDKKHTCCAYPLSIYHLQIRMVSTKDDCTYRRTFGPLSVTIVRFIFVQFYIVIFHIV